MLRRLNEGDSGVGGDGVAVSTVFIVVDADGLDVGSSRRAIFHNPVAFLRACRTLFVSTAG